MSLLGLSPREQVPDNLSEPKPQASLPGEAKHPLRDSDVRVLSVGMGYWGWGAWYRGPRGCKQLSWDWRL